MPEEKISKVTIGIPVYNNEKTLSKAIDSILLQNIPVNILLSDDGSIDGSWELCQQFSSKYSFIKAIKQPQNLYYMNFKYLVDNAETPYFCWLAGDDYLEPGFLEKALDELESTDAVLISGLTRFYENEEFSHDSISTFEIVDNTPTDRILSYLYAKNNDNSRMYGMLRTDIARISFPRKLFHAWDVAFSIITLHHGKHLEMAQVAVHRDKTDPIAYRKMVRRDNKSALTRLFPFLPLTVYLFVHSEVKFTFKVTYKLVRINWRYHLNYCEVFHPKYRSCIRYLNDMYIKWIGWRFKEKNN